MLKNLRPTFDRASSLSTEDKVGRDLVWGGSNAGSPVKSSLELPLFEAFHWTPQQTSHFLCPVMFTFAKAPILLRGP